MQEPIAPDPQDDRAMHVGASDDWMSLPAPGGAAREGWRPVDSSLPRASPQAVAYGPARGADVFVADRDTRRPEVSHVEDVFTPSIAPFERFAAFDEVGTDDRLYVRDPRRIAVAIGPAPSVGEVVFHADLLVDLAPGREVRIPSVGPGARIVRARLIGSAPRGAIHVTRDSADNWFLEPTGVRAPTEGRLVMDLAIAPAAFGGEWGDPSWRELPPVRPLPEAIERDAARVREAVGVSRSMRPRDALARMVRYFRSFAASEDPPVKRGSIYLDLALSKKGVCRHRAFAFFITARSTGLPARVVINEAHAWVEVNDGDRWRRIDLGGAALVPPAAAPSLPERLAYQEAADPFGWPPDARRGQDLGASARARSGGAAGEGTTDAESMQVEPPAPGMGGLLPERPPSTVTLTVGDGVAHRGMPLYVEGGVRSDGQPCAHVAVEVWLRDLATRKMVPIGSLATDEGGRYAGSIVVPAAASLGDYEVEARTLGDARCGSGASG